MAATKKTTKKKAPAKRTTARKAPVKKVVRKKAVHRAPVRRRKVVKSQSFKVAPETKPFVMFKVTDQTLYWLVLSAFVLFFGIWLTQIQSDIQRIYDNIEVSNSTTGYIRYPER